MYQPHTRSNTKRLLMTAADDDDDDVAAAVATAGCSDDDIKAVSYTHLTLPTRSLV